MELDPLSARPVVTDGMQPRDVLDEIQLELTRQPHADEVRLQLSCEQPGSLNGENSVDEAPASLADENAEKNRVTLTFFRTILILINSLGTYFYRNNSKKHPFSDLQIAWKHLRQYGVRGGEADGEMLKLLKSMKKLDTKFYQFFLRDHATSRYS